MKKTLAMLLAIMMLCALMAGCGQSNQPAASSAASETAAENNGASEEATSFKVGFIVSAVGKAGKRTYRLRLALPPVTVYKHAYALGAVDDACKESRLCVGVAH